jgi:hypothetical protein
VAEAILAQEPPDASQRQWLGCWYPCQHWPLHTPHFLLSFFSDWPTHAGGQATVTDVLGGGDVKVKVSDQETE